MFAHRLCALVVLGTALCAPTPGVARADDIRSLGEASFLAELATGSPRRAATAARTHAAEAAIPDRGPRPNPSLTYEREAVPGLDSHDDTLRLLWPVDLSGRRDLALDAARDEAGAVGADAARELHVLAIDARRAYAIAAIARERVAVLGAARARLAALVEQLATRARGGDAAAYDAERVALELDLLDDELATADRELAGARRVLGGLLGDARRPIDAADDVALPVVTPPSAPVRDDVEAAQRRARAARGEARRARRWFPLLELGVGVRRSVTAQDTGLGYVVTIGGELPLLERGAASARRADATAAMWDAEAAALTTEAATAVELAHAETVAATTQARGFADGPARRAAALTHGARVAYVEGDRGLVELLDALATERRAEARALELRLHARLAELELWRALGRTP